MFTEKNILDYCSNLSSELSEELLKIRENTHKNVFGSAMMSDASVVKILQIFAFTMNAKICIDIGTYTGFSAIAMAEATCAEAKIFTIDKLNQSGYFAAKEAFSSSKHREKIHQIIGDAITDIAKLPNNIDIAFVDADKARTLEYVELLLPKLNERGVIIVDDVLWRGEVLNPVEKRAVAIAKFNENVKNNKNIDSVILPIHHGLQLIRKKKN